MPRPPSLLPALRAVLAALVVLAVGLPALAVRPAPAHATGGTDAPDASQRSASVARAAQRSEVPAAENDDPLGVSIASITPSTIPRKGPIRITGSVTNRTDETWRAINLHPFVGNEPITSSAALATEGERSAEEYVGDRITVPGNFDNVPELAPGESASYSIKLSRSVVDATGAGVYWFGVHALAESDSTLRGTVGRARTFIPLVPRTNKVLPAALVVPVRHDVAYQADGRIAGVSRWARDLEDGGPLRSLVDFGAAAGDRPLTWLVDPAVLDGVQQLVDGNPARSLADTVEAPTSEENGGESDGEPSSPSPSDGESTPAEDETAGPEVEDLPPTAATEPGTAWLNRFREAVGGNQVLALPYGDLDVSAALEHDPDTYQQARRRSGGQLEPFGFAATPAVASPSGYVDPTALADLPDRTTILATERMFGATAPGLARVDGRRLVVTSAATEGGPGPDDPLGAVAVRQQILSEAAVRLLTPGQRKPLVVVFPADWTPSGTTAFFAGLDVDWLDLTDLDGLGPRSGGTVAADRLTYPDTQVRRELTAANFASATALTDAGATLQNVLLLNDEVASTVADEALTGLSYADRDHPDAARVTTDRARVWVTRQLGKVRISAPPAVTLSSSRGKFSATVLNNLDHPVTVRVQAVLDEPMRISGPETIQVPANGRTSVLLDAATDRLGVTNVQLMVTDEAGTPLGATDELPIRSGQVSQVIWVILAAGVALLFGAIFVRLVRRIARARSARAATPAGPS